jgi:hypothetical protein
MDINPTWFFKIIGSGGSMKAEYIDPFIESIDKTMITLWADKDLSIKSDRAPMKIESNPIALEV